MGTASREEARWGPCTFGVVPWWRCTVGRRFASSISVGRRSIGLSVGGWCRWGRERLVIGTLPAPCPSTIPRSRSWPQFGSSLSVSAFYLQKSSGLPLPAMPVPPVPPGGATCCLTNLVLMFFLFGGVLATGPRLVETRTVFSFDLGVIWPVTD